MWQPSASFENLKLRAHIFQSIRNFFAARDVMEVDTPLLCHASVTDPYIESIPAAVKSRGETKTYYLQTSPEYAMKRLLAAGSGAIYQISKAFRQEEIGRFHNPEFTLLEWYRPTFTHHDLMNEMDELLQTLLNTPAAERKSYAELFQSYLNLNPHTATLAELEECAKINSIFVAGEISDRDTWLQLLMSHCIEPTLGTEAPCFVYDFPMSQAALARIQLTDPKVASRFEVYIEGIELANGFHELTDANEQRLRFTKNIAVRKSMGTTLLPIDEFFLSALEHGLPDCAGVALGLDRLIMIASRSKHIKECLSFDFTRA